MAEEKYREHHAGNTAAERIASRLRNSGDTKHADHSVVHGTGPTRAYTNIHSAGGQTCVPPTDVRTQPTPKADNRGRFPKTEDR